MAFDTSVSLSFERETAARATVFYWVASSALEKLKNNPGSVL